MKLLVLSPDYPDQNRNISAFVKQLVDEFARQGHLIEVVAPYSVTHNNLRRKRIEEYSLGSGSVRVIRPLYMSFSNFKIGKWSLTNWGKRRAYERGIKQIKDSPDVVYGHFWYSAFCGYSYAKTNRIPLFVATGESVISFRADTRQKKDFCEYLSGVICVSSKNRDESISLNLTKKEKCLIAPNAINSQLFKKLDKEESRTKLGLPTDVFIVAFVGAFNHRKGSKRVAEAVAGIYDKPSVFSIFLGDGDEQPVCENILFKGTINHQDIPLFLNASDAFILPTLHEGCCNAIIEAMACGLPIISSDLSFNHDILNCDNAILIDPLDIESIRQAILRLRDDLQLRTKLSTNAIVDSGRLTIDKRAKKIIDFINDRIK